MLYLDRMDLVETRRVLKDAARVAKSAGNRYGQDAWLEEKLHAIIRSMVKIEDIEESMY